MLSCCWENVLRPGEKCLIDLWAIPKASLSALRRRFQYIWCHGAATWTSPDGTFTGNDQNSTGAMQQTRMVLPLRRFQHLWSNCRPDDFDPAPKLMGRRVSSPMNWIWATHARTYCVNWLAKNDSKMCNYIIAILHLVLGDPSHAGDVGLVSERSKKMALKLEVNGVTRFHTGRAVFSVDWRCTTVNEYLGDRRATSNAEDYELSTVYHCL